MVKDGHSKEHTNIDTPSISQESLNTDDTVSEYSQLVRNKKVMCTVSLLRRVCNMEKPILNKSFTDREAPAWTTTKTA